MSQIDRIVEVQISRQTQQIDIASFDIPLMLVRVDEATIDMPNRVETFTSLEAVGGFFGTEHVAYKMTKKLLSGDLKPATFKIGRVSFSSFPGQGVATGEVEGSTITEPVDYEVTEQPEHGDVTVTEDGFYSYTGDPGYSGEDTFTVTLTDEEDETEEVEITVEVVATPDEAETYTEALQAVLEADNEWYTLLSDARFDQDILALAGVIQGLRKIYLTSTSDINVTSTSSTTDIGSLLMEGAFSRTAVMYSPYANEDYPECAWTGTQLIEVPGSNTWAFKRLEGIRVAKLSDTQIQALESKNVNYYTTVKGAPITQTGNVSSGEWID